MLREILQGPHEALDALPTVGKIPLAKGETFHDGMRWSNWRTAFGSATVVPFSMGALRVLRLKGSTMISHASKLKGVDKAEVRARGDGNFHISVYAPKAEAEKNFVQVIPETGNISVGRVWKPYTREAIGIDAPVVNVVIRSGGTVEIDGLTLKS